MKKIIENLEEIQKRVFQKNSKNMIVPILMDEEDEKINKVLDNFNPDKESENLKVSIEIAWLLMGFGFNMATYSLRTGNQRYFTNGLNAIEIASQSIDSRDAMRLLPLYWDVFKQKELSFEPIISQNTEFSKTLQKFLNREEADKTLKSMSFMLIGEGENIQYQVINR